MAKSEKKSGTTHFVSGKVLSDFAGEYFRSVYPTMERSKKITINGRVVNVVSGHVYKCGPGFDGEDRQRPRQGAWNTATSKR